MEWLEAVEGEEEEPPTQASCIGSAPARPDRYSGPSHEAQLRVAESKIRVLQEAIVMLLKYVDVSGGTRRAILGMFVDAEFMERAEFEEDKKKQGF